MEQLKPFSWVFAIIGSLLMVGFASALFLSQGKLDTYGTVLGTLALMSMVTFLFVERQGVSDAVASRSFAYGSGSFLMVVIVACIGVAGFAVAERYDKRWDLTSSRSYTLSDSTLKVLEGLEGDVRIFAFFPRESTEESSFKDLVRGYTAASSKVRVEFTDPLSNPIVAKQFAITSDYGTVVLEMGESRQRLESDFDEDNLTNALVRLVSGEEHNLCWSTGHGERDPDADTDPLGYGTAVVKLEDRNFKFTKVSVASEGIPRACEAFIIVDPQVDWLPYEREALAAYVAMGGRVYVSLDIQSRAFGLVEEMERYGVLVGDDVALDPSPDAQLMGMDPSVIMLTERNYKPHVITQPLKAMAVLALARSVQPLRESSEFARVRVLAETTDQAWAETNLLAEQPKYDMEADLRGPVPLMVSIEIGRPEALGVAAPGSDEGPLPPGNSADDLPKSLVEGVRNLEALVNTVLATGEDDRIVLDAADLGTFEAAMAQLEEAGAPEAAMVVAALGAELQQYQDASARLGAAAMEEGAARAVPADFAPKEGGRLVVVGDADFASNQHIKLGNNQDLFANSLAWLIDEEDQISERPDEEADILELSVLETLLVWLISLGLVPGAAVGASVLLLFRRRYL